MVATRLPLPRLVDDLFDDLFDRARIGMSLPLLIRGTHGAGKSEQLRRMQLRAADMLVVEGAAVASDSGVPYAALRSLTRSAETAARQLVDASVFHRLWGDGSGDALDAHGGVLTELERFFTRLGELAPTLLAFDDLHHADAASCQAMLHLVRHLRGSPVFMVLTSAHEPLLEPRLAATLERYQRASELEIIELGPLDRAAVRAVVASRLDAEPDPALLDHIVELSKGNAMFVVESVATLDSLGLIVCESGRARLASETPIIPVVSRPRRVIEGVLALGDEAHRLAVVAAWATSVSVSDLPALAASSGLPRAEADLAFDRLVAAGVLETAGDRFQFAVPLVQAALRGELGPARRAALEPIHDSPSLIELIIAEGDTSSASQPQSAIEMYRRALDLQDRASVDDPTLRLKLAHALTFAARHREGAGLAIDLLESPEPDVRVEACELAVAALRSANRHDEAASILDNALGDPAMCSPRLLLARAELSFWCDDLRAARVHLLAARRAGLTELEPVAVALERELDLAAGLPRSTAALDAARSRVGRCLAAAPGAARPPGADGRRRSRAPREPAPFVHRRHRAARHASRPPGMDGVPDRELGRRRAIRTRGSGALRVVRRTAQPDGGRRAGGAARRARVLQPRRQHAPPGRRGAVRAPDHRLGSRPARRAPRRGCHRPSGVRRHHRPLTAGRPGDRHHAAVAVAGTGGGAATRSAAGDHRRTTIARARRRAALTGHARPFAPDLGSRPRRRRVGGTGGRGRPAARAGDRGCDRTRGAGHRRARRGIADRGPPRTRRSSEPSPANAR